MAESFTVVIYVHLQYSLSFLLSIIKKLLISIYQYENQDTKMADLDKWVSQRFWKKQTDEYTHWLHCFGYWSTTQAETLEGRAALGQQTGPGILAGTGPLHPSLLFLHHFFSPFIIKWSRHRAERGRCLWAHQTTTTTKTTASSDKVHRPTGKVPGVPDGQSSPAGGKVNPQFVRFPHSNANAECAWFWFVNSETHFIEIERMCSKEKVSSRVFCPQNVNTQGHVQCILLLFHEHDHNLAWHLLLVHWHPVVFFQAGQTFWMSRLRLHNKMIPVGSLSSSWHHATGFTKCLSSPSGCFWPHWHSHGIFRVITSPHCQKRRSLRISWQTLQQIFEKLDQIIILCFQMLVQDIRKWKVVYPPK